MAQYINEIWININEIYKDQITAKQFDAKSRYLKVHLTQDNNIPFDLTDQVVQFHALKEDLKSVMNNVKMVDAENGTFTVELTDQTLAMGDSFVRAEFVVLGDNAREILRTRTFEIWVEKTITDFEAIESSDEYNAVWFLFRDVWDIRDIINDMHQKLGELSDNATADQEAVDYSISGKLNWLINYVKTQGTAGLVEAVNHIKGVVDEILAIISSGPTGKVIFDTPGEYEWTVPKRVKTIYVTACGGGGSGGGSLRYVNTNKVAVYAASGGGGGADAIMKKSFVVAPQSNIKIIVGAGGAAKLGYGTSVTAATGNTGAPTIIHTFVTLSGGAGGQSTTNGDPIGGDPGGVGGGKGAEHKVVGERGIFGAGGESGGGGGSLGNGAYTYSRPGFFGGGGGGVTGASFSGDAEAKISGKGGDGFCMIEW